MAIKRLKYWSLIQKFAKFVVKELESTIIMEVKCVQVAGPFFVELFKAMVLKVGGHFNPGLFNSKLPLSIFSRAPFFNPRLFNHQLFIVMALLNLRCKFL